MKDSNNCEKCTCCPKVDDDKCKSDCHKLGKVPKHLSSASGCETCECTCPDYDAQTCKAFCATQGQPAIEGVKDSFGCPVCQCCFNETRDGCNSGSKSILTKSQETALEICLFILAISVTIVILVICFKRTRKQRRRLQTITSVEMNVERYIEGISEPITNGARWLSISDIENGEFSEGSITMLPTADRLESSIVSNDELEEVITNSSLSSQSRGCYGYLTCSSDGNSQSGSDGDQCCICMERPLEILCKPCQHYCMCEKCWHSLRSTAHGHVKCPLCRTVITKYVPTKDAQVHHFG